MTTFSIILAVYATILGIAFIVKEGLPGQKITEKNVQRILKKLGCTDIETIDGTGGANYEQGRICVSYDDIPYAGFMVKGAVKDDFKMDLIKKTIKMCNKTGGFTCHLGEDNSVSMMIIKPVFYIKELEESIKKLIPFMDEEGMKIFIEYYDAVERNEWKAIEQRQ